MIMNILEQKIICLWSEQCGGKSQHVLDIEQKMNPEYLNLRISKKVLTQIDLDFCSGANNKEVKKQKLESILSRINVLSV